MWRPISSYQTRSLKPKVTGSAWMPCVRPMQTVLLVLEGLALEDAAEGPEVGQDALERLLDEQRKGRVDDVVGGQSEVDVARVGPDLLGDRGQEGDDVVLDDLLDGLDPFDGEAGLGLDRPQRRSGDLAQPGPGLADGQFDGQPLAGTGSRRSRSPPCRGGCSVRSWRSNLVGNRADDNRNAHAKKDGGHDTRSPFIAPGATPQRPRSRTVGKNGERVSCPPSRCPPAKKEL